MNGWDKAIGPGTIVYLVSATVASLWWASSINSDVKALQKDAVSAERVAKLEGKVDALKDNTADLKTAVNQLVVEIRRQP